MIELNLKFDTETEYNDFITDLQKHSKHEYAAVFEGRRVLVPAEWEDVPPEDSEPGAGPQIRLKTPELRSTSYHITLRWQGDPSEPQIQQYKRFLDREDAPASRFAGTKIPYNARAKAILAARRG